MTGKQGRRRRQWEVGVDEEDMARQATTARMRRSQATADRTRRRR